MLEEALDDEDEDGEAEEEGYVSGAKGEPGCVLAKGEAVNV